MGGVPEKQSWSLTTRGRAGQAFWGYFWRFPSGRRHEASLEVRSVPKWRNGRRRGFKIPRWQHRVSSNLTLGTTSRKILPIFCLPAPGQTTRAGGLERIGAFSVATWGLSHLLRAARFAQIGPVFLP